MNWKKIIAGTGIGAGVVWAIAYASRLRRTATQLESVVTAKLHSLKLDGLTIRVDVLLKNPGPATLKIKFPFVKLIYKGGTLGSSDPINKDIIIPAYGEAHIDQIMIKLPVIELLSLSAGVIKMLAKKEPVTILVKTITELDLGWKKIPYERNDEKTIYPLS